MTLRSDLAALLADAGIVDMDIGEAAEDEHVRLDAYRKVIAVIAASGRRFDDRAVAAILRDPVATVSKTAIVELVDTVAMETADADEFQQWAAGLALLGNDGHDRFVRRRPNDWAVYLAIRGDRTPETGLLMSVTAWMQRIIAEESTAPSVLGFLAENGRTRKIRNIARHRARHCTVRPSP
ncbi:hypothetical protein [Actinomadura welshii]|uniref:hypothetical protein n=1 Tax=Actinomadura welshii TaxID=3103817 RepID=UPI00041F9519|nr:hypothetical protein [Actinomadura madurae]